MGKIKYLRHPAFTLSELSLKNPLLFKGEIVVALDDNTLGVSLFKIGDGINSWNDLPAQAETDYPYTDPVTNPLGDLVLGSDISGTPINDVLRDIISPYTSSIISNVLNDAEGSSKNIAQMEIGQSITGPVTFLFSVSNQDNLVGATPMEVDSDGDFIDNNPHAVGSIILNPSVPINPASNPLVVTVSIKAIHQQGESEAITQIKFDPRIIHGASALSDLTSKTDIDAILPSGGSVISSDLERDYEISTIGYGYVLIPSMLDQNGIVWTDVTNPDAPSTLGMVNLGEVSYNNGVGTYNYTKYRTPFSQTISQTTLRARI